MRIENRFANIFVPKWRDLKTFSWNFNFNFAVTTSLPTTSISTSLLLYILRNCNHGGMVVVKPSPSSHISRWFFQQNSSPASEVSKLSKWKRKAWIFTICIFLELNNFSIELYFNFIIFVFLFYIKSSLNKVIVFVIALLSFWNKQSIKCFQT